MVWGSGLVKSKSHDQLVACLVSTLLPLARAVIKGNKRECHIEISTA